MFLSFGLAAGSFAQNLNFNPYFEYGGMFGVTQYRGDLNSRVLHWQEAGKTYGVMGRYYFTPKISARAAMTLGRISGDDKHARKPELLQRNLNFFSSLFEISFTGEYNILGFNSGTNRRYPGLFRQKATPYVFGGFSIFHFNPKTKYEGETYVLRPLLTESTKSYSLTQFALPMGFGVKYNFMPFWALAIEVGYRKIFTDYLDDVSGFYVDYNTVLELQGQAAAALSDRSREFSPDWNYQKPTNVTRGNPDKNDSFYFLGITVSKKLHQRQKRW